MTEKPQEPQRGSPVAMQLPTRRALLTRNIKAIGALAATAAAARVLAPMRAAAHPIGCFLSGTRIETVPGDRAVEDLAVGDLLPTVFGGTQPIQWLARFRRRKETGKPWKRHALPVCIKRSALAPDVPRKDLYVTGEHALFIDGVLVSAARLINGTTIVPFASDACDEMEFFHIKLATHDVICAEGAPCETLLSVDETVSNFAEYFRAYGTPVTPEVRCAPIYGRGARAEIKSRLRRLLSPGLGAEPIDIISDRLEGRALLVP
jgi:hypothetical protein